MKNIVNEIAVYLIAAIASLAILGYSVHMLIGGIVRPETEQMIIAGAVLAGAVCIALLARDVIRARRKQR